MKFCLVSIVILFSLLTSSCVTEKGEVTVKLPSVKRFKTDQIDNAKILNIKIENNQLLVTGTSLDIISKIRIESLDKSFNHDFVIESKNSNQIIANSSSPINLAVNSLYRVLISNSYGAASFEINFNLCNASFGSSRIDCALSANDKDVLSYDAATNEWKPRAVNGLNYLGSFDASSGAAPTAQPSGSYYIISVAGIISGINFEVGDWIVSNGVAYQKIDNSSAITSVFGRTGAVTALEGDYSLDKLLDVDLTVTPVAGKILKFDGTKWVASDDLSGGGAGSVSTSTIADGAVTDLKISDVAASKITGALSASQIGTGVISNVHISNTAAIDYSKLNIGLGVIPQDRINGLSATLNGLISSSITNGDTTHAPSSDVVYDNLALKFDKAGGALTPGSTITGLPTLPLVGSEATSKDYVDNRFTALSTTGVSEGTNLYYTDARVRSTLLTGFDNSLTGQVASSDNLVQAFGRTQKQINDLTTSMTGNQWSASGADVYRTAGNVGIRTTPTSDAFRSVLEVGGTANGGKLVLSETGGDSFSFHSDQFGYLHMYNSLGGSSYHVLSTKVSKVGIGTVNPEERLQIHISSGLDKHLLLTNTTTGAAKTDGHLVYLSGDDLVFNNQEAAAGAKTYFRNDGVDVFTITDLGNVGIGTITPSEKFEVVGNVKATQLCIGADCRNAWPTNSIAAGSITTTEIADGTILNADIANDTISPVKLNGTRDSSKYLKGDNSWATFATDVVNSVLSTFALDSGTKPAITNTDTVVGAFGKVQKNLNDINADYVSKTGTNAVTGSFNLTGITSFLQIPTSTGAVVNEAANVQYVQNYVGSFGQWLENGTNIYYSAGNVGIGTTTPNQSLHATGSVQIGGRSYVTGDTGNSMNIPALVMRYDTTNNYGEIFARDYSSATQKFLILQSGGGNVGIGTTSPGAKLEVAGQVKITGGTPGLGKVLTSDATGLATWEIPGAGAAAGANTQIQYNNAGVLSANSQFVWNHTNNRLGIGTASPNYKIDVVNGTVHATSPCGGTVAGCSAIFGDATGTSPSAGVYGVTSLSNSFAVYGNSTGAATGGYFTSTSGAALVTGTGNVGIGVSSPVEKLEVNGDVKAKFFYAGKTGQYSDGGGAVAFDKWIRIAETGDPYTEISWGKILIAASGRGTSHAEISFSCSGFGNCDISVDKFVVPSTSMTIAASSGIKGIRVVYDSATFANPAYIDVLMRNDGGSGATTMTSYLAYGKNTTLYSTLVEASTSTPARTIMLNDSNSMLSNSFARGNINFTRSGSVGIGTTNPTAKLQVSGGTTSLEQAPWVYPALTNGWSNYGAGYANFGYRIDSMGYLRLRGLIKNGAAGSANSFFTLPVGFRPQFIQEFVVAAPSGTANIIINTTGVMYVETMSSNAWVSLDNVSLPLD